jgi:hypothetical protein
MGAIQTFSKVGGRYSLSLSVSGKLEKTGKSRGKDITIEGSPGGLDLIWGD